jgi:prevent-host-death family protein
VDVSAHWQLQEAKQRFSEVVRSAEAEGPQFVTRHGDEVAVVLTSGNTGG